MKPEQLRAARAALGITTRQLADMAGVGVNTVNRIERGRHAPQDATADAIGRALAMEGADVRERKSEWRLTVRCED